MKPKKLKIAVGINSLIATTHPAYSNHIQFFFRLGRNYLDIDFCLINPSRMSIDRMRNMSAEVCLNQEFDYLMFLDDDVLVPIDCLRKLIECNVDIAAGDVFVRGYPFHHMAFRHPNGNINALTIVKDWNKKEPTIAKVDAVGFSCCLLKTSLLKKIPKPYFITGPSNTEDVYFCMKARTIDPATTIVVDRSIKCGHILWNEVITHDNRASYKTYYEKNFGKEDKKANDRGKEYLETVEKSFKRA